MRTRSVLGIVLAAAAAIAAPARGQDPLPLYPGNYTLLFENDRVRVLDFRLRRGDSEAPHHHPAHVAYILVPMKIRFTLADGSVRLREAKAGDVLFSEETTHASLNIGDTDAHGILVELKAGVSATSRPPAADWLTAVTFIDGIAGQEASLERHLLDLSAPTRSEPGNRQYDLFQSVDDPTRFVRVEMWTDLAALEAHKQLPHMRASFEKRQREGWMTRITLWKRVGD